MLTNNRIKFIKSLEYKKIRKESGCFIVEGEKMVDELIHSRFEVEEIFALQSYIDKMPRNTRNICITPISQKDLERISLLKTPNQVVAIAHIPETENNTLILQKGLSIALENVQDPGNMGTIVRTAAWFGINNIYCSPDTVDVYSPKVIQSTMGAVFKVNVVYCDLQVLAKEASAKKIALYGTRLDGENMYSAALPANAIIVMGNESKGMSEKLSGLMSKNIKIPSYATNYEMESLNVSIATAIVCAEFRRQNPKQPD